ncbi:MAG: 4-hydroxy-tetrahydrodipicolinate reductase [Pseudomonadota bacterium]
MDKKIKLIISGANGRMGSLIVQLAQQSANFVVVGQAEKDQPLEAVIAKGEVVIDFSAKEAAADHALVAARNKVPLVIGTTGLSLEEELEIKKASEIVPIVYAPNMSIGVNLLWKLAGRAAAVLAASSKIKIIEEHHVHKKDQPSGTAKKLLEVVVAEAGLNQQQAKEINIESIRQGETIGDHLIRFTSADEILEIKHQALDRKVFAQGALRAAQWIIEKPPALYTMEDVLGLKG